MVVIRKYQSKKLNDITPYARNNKVHWDNVDRIASSIKRNEYITPIVVNGDGVILAGHGRKLALEKMWETEAEVLVVTWLTEKQEADFRIADNRTTELSEWDFDAVLEEIEKFELDELKIDFPDLEIDEPNYNDLIGEERNKPFSVKITSKEWRDRLDMMMEEITPILVSYDCFDWSFSWWEL